MRSQVGQEPKLAEVYAQHRSLAVAHLVRGAEDRAVAAEDDRPVGIDIFQVGGELKVPKDDVGVPRDEFL